MVSFIYEYKRFSNYSSCFKKDRNSDLNSLASNILMKTHSVEKGLSLKNTRKNFGIANINDLKDIQKTKNKNWYLDWADKVLESYDNFHKLSDKKFKSKNYATKLIKKNDRYVSSDFIKFLRSRYSSRQFTNEKVKKKDLLKAIKFAQNAPSVCNRQTSKIHIFSKKDTVSKILNLQNGNKGFGSDAAAILVITADLRSFFYTNEHKQPWFDSGLFSMMLNLGLHMNGIGSCMLNWCTGVKNDKMLRKIINLNNAEVVTTLMAIGMTPDEYPVATSPRKPLKDVLMNYDFNLKDGGL